LTFFDYVKDSDTPSPQIGFNKTGNFIESYYKLPQDKGNGYIYRLYHGDGLFIAIGDYVLDKPLERHYENEQMCLEIHYIESGDMFCNIEDGRKMQQLSPGINLYVNRQKPGRLCYGTGAQIQYISIILLEEYIENAIRREFPEKNFNWMQVLGWEQQHYDTPEIALTFMQLKHNLRSPQRKRMYYESKVGEILLLIMRQHQADKEKQQGLSPILTDDIRYMHLVKATIEQNILHPPTMPELCLLTGMGTTKLKASFKSAFGTTIHRYLKTARMKRALVLLLDNSMTVSMVAAAVGYKNAGNFAAAFKSIYTLSPNEYRKCLKTSITPTKEIINR